MEPCDLSEQMASRSAAEDGCDAHQSDDSAASSAVTHVQTHFILSDVK